jgi:hypothetical protein
VRGVIVRANQLERALPPVTLAFFGVHSLENVGIIGNET